MTDHELYWLAGLLEGEGSFLRGPPSCPNQPRIQMAMTDEDIVRRAAALMHVSVWSGNRNPGKWKPTFHLLLRGRRAVWLMEQLRPLMGERRQTQIDVAIASVDWSKYRRRGRCTMQPEAERRARRPQLTHPSRRVLLRHGVRR